MGKNPNKDPNKPKRPISAYFIFMADLREKCKRTQEIDTSDVTKFTKHASEKWKELNEEKGERKQWQDRAALDKERYEIEMASYQPPPGMTGRGSRKKQKDPYAPKRPKSSYLFYLDKFREENKHHLNHKEIVKNGAEAWSRMNDEEKKPFQLQHEKAKAEYTAQVQALGSY